MRHCHISASASKVKWTPLLHFEHCIISFLVKDPTHFDTEQQVVLVKELSASSHGGEAPSNGKVDVDFVFVDLRIERFY